MNSWWLERKKGLYINPFQRVIDVYLGFSGGLYAGCIIIYKQNLGIFQKILTMNL
jgi:hypothetical protein